MAKKPTRTSAPDQGKAGMAKGFKFGLNNMLECSKASVKLPKSVQNHYGTKPRPGVWHPGAERP